MPIQVIWTLNKAGNTGHALLPNVLTFACNTKDISTSSIQPQQTPNLPTLITWCVRNNFTLHLCPLVESVTGIRLHCFAEPYDSKKEHKGKNNVVATYMTCRTLSGLAPHTITGRAVFVRVDPKNGDKPVDLDRDEFLRIVSCINDLMQDVYGTEELDVNKMVKDVRKCYPFYDPSGKGDTMGKNGFHGIDEGGVRGGRFCYVGEDGELDRSEGVWEVVPTYGVSPAVEV
ncbi:hypothetical protein HK102_007540 [Quaeritorhiza haematococci]|nr:hypothetical protein HK102_007540 [Quaeritorhiza haematococci]